MGQRVTFNLDDLAIEAENEPPFTFTWNGSELSMPTLQQMDWRDQASFWQADDGEERMRLLLGKVGFAAFITKRASTARVAALLDEWWKFQGVTQGESKASTDS